MYLTVPITNQNLEYMRIMKNGVQIPLYFSYSTDKYNLKYVLT